MARKVLLFDKTEESIYTLLSLCVLISQAFESLVNDENIYNADFDYADSTFEDLVNDTIREALIYQILLKSCAYLDEWNKIFGVATELKDKEIIITIRKIAKPAYKNVMSWKQLKDFRNHFIAHNHRDSEGKNIYLNNVDYNSPQSIGEIYLLVYSLKRMTDVVYAFYPDAAAKALQNKSPGSKSNKKFLSKQK